MLPYVQVLCIYLIAKSSLVASLDPACAGLQNEFYLNETSSSDGLQRWLRWTVNVNSTDTSKSTLTMQYEVATQAWLSFGIAKVDGMMDGAEAVIGLPGNNTVLKYDLYTYGVTPMPAEKQTLMNASIVQDEVSTILTYTKYLEEEGELPIIPGMVMTLGATGMGNELGYHGPVGRGGAPFPFFADCIDGELAPPPSTDTPTSNGNRSGSVLVVLLFGLVGILSLF